MKTSIYIISFLLLLYSFPFTASAQQYTKELSTTSKKAAKSYEQGRMYISVRDYVMAEEEMLKAIRYDPEFIEAYLILGDIYSDLGRVDDAIGTYKMAISINPGFFPRMLYITAAKEMTVGKYQDAKTHLLLYLQFPESTAKMKSINKLLGNCDFAVNAMQNPVSFKPVNLGAEVNSQFPEYFPCLTVDDKTLLFTRRIPDAKTRRVHEDFYTSILRDGRWTKSRNVGPPINTLFNEGAPTLSTNGRVLIFTACEYIDERYYGPDRNGFGSCDLFFTQKIGDEWTPPRNMGALINSSNWETQPSYSSDGKTLYFIRGLPGRDKLKSMDIWMSELENGHWKKPTKLSDKINTSGIEESVYIHPDGQTLYFSSDGHPGMGGLDLFVARKDDKGEWENPKI